MHIFLFIYSDPWTFCVGTGGELWVCRYVMQTAEVIASVTRTGANQASGPLYSCCMTSLLIRTHGSPWWRYVFTWPGWEVENENATYSMLFIITAISSLCLHLKQYLPKHLHLLCVDMPGHEGTTRTSTDDYSIQGQVKRIRQVILFFLRTIRYA